MAMSNVGRPTAPGSATSEGFASLTGGRGLLQDEPLLFELGGWDKTGVDFDAPCYLVVMLGEFRPPRPGQDPADCESRRAAAFVIEARSGRSVASCVSVDLPDTRAVKLIALARL